MKILEYSGFDPGRCRAQYREACAAIARDDFRAADVKKLANLAHGKFYRARLNYADRLIFALLRHGEEVCALMLEIVENHDYDKSRFLRGAAIDESRIPDADAATEASEAQPLRYLHPTRKTLHLLDKPISFDDAQEAIYRRPPPLIIVGSAGSGKTALTLEKLKHAEGEVLYVTHSAFLAQGARDLYYANGFEPAGQEALFLSYREFVETIHVAPGREVQWRDFAAWFSRQPQFRDLDPHQALEEIRGVITADADGILDCATYRGLGVRQSIYPEAERERIHELFQKYRDWLAQAKLCDTNLLAHERLPLAAARYDFVVIDEVQDLTAVQLALVLRTLRKPGHFLLCGDSNQIVHPNFFSWSRVKSLFWRDETLAARQELAVLNTNFRNGREATRLANRLLTIKHRRFGSIDRESNFLVEAIGGTAGAVALLPDKDPARQDLGRGSRQSTAFAVLVLRDEDKAEARRHFATPLLFSVHEAKGLEYENIVLYRFVSGHRAAFAEIANGVDTAGLDVETLDYRRARDKTDKSLETYKFFVNALYVALTRAVKNVYLVESDLEHPIFALLGLQTASAPRVETRTSSLEEWQREARKLELQGKDEQAEAIRRSILRETPVPWPVFDEARLRELLVRVFRDQVPGGKPRQQLYEYATCHTLPGLADWLHFGAGHAAAANYDAQHLTLGRVPFMPYYAKNPKEVLRQCEKHGIDHRTPMNHTPLIAAAHSGNLPLIDALLERGADPQATDHYGCNALHWAMREAFRDEKFARGPFAAIYERVAPAAIDVEAGGRLVRIDRHLSEYFLFQTLWALFQTRFDWREKRLSGAFDTTTVLAAWAHLPANVVSPERNRRQHLSSVFARNEVDRDYAYNRALFKRLAQGRYQFAPALRVRRRTADGELWVPVFAALNLPLLAETATTTHSGVAAELAGLAGLPALPEPIVACARHRKEAAEAAEWQRRGRERLAELTRGQGRDKTF